MPSHSDSKIKKGSFRPIEMRTISRAGLTFGSSEAKEDTRASAAPRKEARPQPVTGPVLKGGVVSGILADAVDYVQLDPGGWQIVEVKTSGSKVYRYSTQGAAQKAARAMAEGARGETVKLTPAGKSVRRQRSRPGAKLGG